MAVSRQALIECRAEDQLTRKCRAQQGRGKYEERRGAEDCGWCLLAVADVVASANQQAGQSSEFGHVDVGGNCVVLALILPFPFSLFPVLLLLAPMMISFIPTNPLSLLHHSNGPTPISS